MHCPHLMLHVKFISILQRVASLIYLVIFHSVFYYCTRFYNSIRVIRFNLDHNLIIPIDTEYLYNNINSYTAKRPLCSGLKTDHIETYIDEPIFSTKYNLKILKNSLGSK